MGTAATMRLRPDEWFLYEFDAGNYSLRTIAQSDEQARIRFVRAWVPVGHDPADHYLDRAGFKDSVRRTALTEMLGQVDAS